MGNNQSKQDIAIRNTRITEAFEDNDLDFFNNLIDTPSIPMSQLLSMKNHDQRTPLHLVCKKGHLDLYYKLVKQHEIHKIGYDAEDERGDTPLSLICSHGFDTPLDLENSQEEAQQQLKDFNMTKAIIIKDLLAKGASIRATCKKKKTTPLHWCIYYGNFEGGNAIFEAFPLIVLNKNSEGRTPLEILLSKNLKSEFKPEAARLVHSIITRFSSALFENNQDFILKNAKLKEIQEFEALQAFKHKGAAFNANDLIRNIQENSKNVFARLLSNKKPGSKGKYMELVDSSLELDKPKNTDRANLYKSIGNHEDSYNTTQLEQDANITVYVYDERKKRPLKNPYLKFLHKLMIVSVYVKDISVVKLLLDNFNISPFVKSIDDLTAIHYASMKGRLHLLKFLLNLRYKYLNSKREFDLKIQINKLAGKEFNTCLHLAVRYNRTKILKELLDKGADINVFNYQDLRPLEMNRSLFFKEIEIRLIQQSEYNDLMKYGDLTNPNSYDSPKIDIVRDNYIYLIVARDLQSDYAQTLVFQQLQFLRAAWMNRIDIRYVEPVVNKTGNYYRFFFLLNIQSELLDDMADILNIEILNLKRGYSTSFYKESAMEYIKFRDYHIHSIILHLLDKEFNLDHYIKSGIIEEAFPLHEFKTRKNLQNNWYLERSTVFFDPWKIKSSPKDLRPFNSLAFYYGCDIAFYISFTTLYTSFLILLGVLGVILYLWVLYSKISIDNITTPVFALLISLWVTITLEQWKRRENEHAFIWNTLSYKNNEIMRIDYKGNYAIDEVSKSITVKDPFPTIKRRWIVY